MLRVRLKADGRLVEMLPDGSERALATDPRDYDGAHNAARSRRSVSSTPAMPATCAARPV